MAPVTDWTEAQRLAGERETLGFFLSGHPITPYEPDLQILGERAACGCRRPETGRAASDGVRSWSAGKAATVAGLGARDPPPAEPGDIDPG